jgi:hypothetical protein
MANRKPVDRDYVREQDGNHCSPGVEREGFSRQVNA